MGDRSNPENAERHCSPRRKIIDMQMSRETLVAALAKPDRTFVYQFGCAGNAGFGADYLGLLSRLITCISLGIGFRFGKVIRPRGFVTNRGWSDYFEPFCDEVEAPWIDRLNVWQFPYARIMPFAKPA